MGDDSKTDSDVTPTAPGDGDESRSQSAREASPSDVNEVEHDSDEGVAVDTTIPSAEREGDGSELSEADEPAWKVTFPPGIDPEVIPTFDRTGDRQQPPGKPRDGIPLSIPDGIDANVIPRIEPISDFLEQANEATVPKIESGEDETWTYERLQRMDVDDDEGVFGSFDGPEEDEEMPLADHIEEMIKRLAVVIVVAGSVSLLTFPFADELIVFIWYSILPGTEVAQPRVYGPLEFLLARIKVASLAGLIVALPVIVYETYAFMRPGLYKHERKYYLAAIPTSLVLAVIGVAFAFFIVLPAIFTYFLAYSEAAGEIAFGLQRTFDLMIILMGYLAIVFQIPLFIILAIMMGLTTRQWLAEKRLYFWGAFLGLSFISSPDPTGMAPIIITLTMVALYEGTLALLKWVGK